MRGATPHLSILGAGPAGLTAAFYARKNGIPFDLYERKETVGGNAVTYEHNGFKFDSGAHRFHDKIPYVTRDLQDLLGENLKKVDIPSAIFTEGQQLTFPVSSAELLRKFGVWRCTRYGYSLVRHRMLNKEGDNFASFSKYRYGPELAQMLLLNYSQKLWGAPCENLSKEITGGRIKKLGVLSALNALPKKFRRERHLEGSFLYPTGGIGFISEELANFAGREHIHTNTCITGLMHDGERITSMTLNDGSVLDIKEVISTLPPAILINLLTPAAPEHLLKKVRELKFRNVLIVFLALDTPSIGKWATCYFPDPSVPFTRASEPRNRCSSMAPKGKTSLLIEIPYSPHEGDIDHEEKAEEAIQVLVELNLIKENQVIDRIIKEIPYAYPVLDIASQEIIFSILSFFDTFKNLTVIGRNGLFRYVHIHELMRLAKECVGELQRMNRENL